MIKRTLILLIFPLALSGCYYDVEEELYPDQPLCDNTAVTFSGTIQPLITSKCLSCHNNALMNGNISLEGYDNIQQQAENGNLFGVVNHDTGFSPMPQGEPKLPDCQIEAIQIWIDNGTPND